MITNLTREFKLVKVPKIVISPDEPAPKQFTKFWNYMYKSVDLDDFEGMKSEVQEALEFFYGGITQSYYGEQVHKLLNVGNTDLGTLKAVDYYTKVPGFKLNPCLKLLATIKDFCVQDGGVGLHFVDKESKTPFIKYRKPAVLVDYSSLQRSNFTLNFKKTRVALFSEATSVAFEKDAYVVHLLDARAVWLAYKFVKLLSDCLQTVDLGEPDKWGRYTLGIYSIDRTMTELPKLAATFLNCLNGADKAYTITCLSIHPAFKNMLAMLHSMYTDQIMIGYQEEYDRELGKTQAAVFQTKKQITKEKLALMDSSKLLGKFSFVEIDNDIDNDTYRFIEEAIDKFPWVLPSNKVELRFRKLGNYKATGLWFPYMNNLCVDIRDVSSFVHEYGHAIDYLLARNKGSQLSLEVDFVDIRTKVFKEYQAMKLDKLGYYGTPTEIFARAFEVYVYNKAYISSLLQLSKDKDLVKAYAPFADEQFYLDMIEPYFDKLLGVDTIQQVYPGELEFNGVLRFGDEVILFSKELGRYEVMGVHEVMLGDVPVVEITEHAFEKMVRVINNKSFSDEEKILYISEGFAGFFNK